MQSFGRPGRYLLRALIALTIVVLAAPALAQERVGVAVILDGPNDRFDSRHDIYVEELVARRELAFHDRPRQWGQKEALHRALEWTRPQRG